MKTRLGAAFLILCGAAWPFFAHWVAMRHLAQRLSQDPRSWVLYSAVVTILPVPALFYSGSILYLRELVPYPACAVFAGLATAVLLAGLAILYYVGVGQIGFTTPLVF